MIKGEEWLSYKKSDGFVKAMDALLNHAQDCIFCNPYPPKHLKCASGEKLYQEYLVEKRLNEVLFKLDGKQF